jgi:hypothetical protein
MIGMAAEQSASRTLAAPIAEQRLASPRGWEIR